MDHTTLFSRFGVALALGILIGLQREYSLGDPDRELFAGARTFALMALFGCAAALASDVLDSPWPLVGAVVVVGSLITAAYYFGAVAGRIGLTTEISSLLTVLVGALCFWDYLALAAALGVTMTLLLSLKPEMQQFVQRITSEDVFATLKFAVITIIILPILPNENFGPPPLDVINPYRIWLMVVFISGISFLGYVLIKAMDTQKGIGLTGLLGGLVSSTAVTLSFAQRSRTELELARPLALAITISWTTMFFRVLVIVIALNFALVQLLWLPMLASAVVGLAYCVYLYYAQRSDKTGDMEFSNPFELRPSIQFGLLYAVILVVSQAAQIYLGDAGVYVSSLVAGLVDLNAITLSISELSHGPGLALGTAARAIVLATIANTAVKGAIVLAIGASELRRVVWPGFVLMMLTAAVVVFFTT